ncbi:MAG: SAM-dependent methyltransferase, partial [Sciscionella sp.]
LHVPYWWMLCLPGMTELDGLPSRYHRFLCWQILNSPRWAVLLERVLNPVLGKSLVLYATRQQPPA